MSRTCRVSRCSRLPSRLDDRRVPLRSVEADLVTCLPGNLRLSNPVIMTPISAAAPTAIGTHMGATYRYAVLPRFTDERHHWGKRARSMRCDANSATKSSGAVRQRV